MDALDGLRGVAAAGIVLIHVWMFVWGDAGRPDRGVGAMAIGELRLGVPLFFALSGFLIYRPFARSAIDGLPRPALGRYAVRRVARIVPGYWLVVLVAFVAMGALDRPEAVGVGELPAFLLLGQNYLSATAGQLDPPLWTVVVEASFYLVLPVVAIGMGRVASRLRDRRARRTVLAALCLALLLLGATAAALQARGVLFGGALTDSLPVHLGEFAAGMLAAVLVHGRHLRSRASALVAAAGVALVLTDAVGHAGGVSTLALRQTVGDVPAVLGFALLIGALASGRVPGSVVLARGPLKGLGTISFGLYLWHFPVILVLRSADLWPGSLAAAFALTTLVALVIAVGSWVLLERPAIAWAGERTAPGPQRSAGSRSASDPASPGMRRRSQRALGWLPG